VLQGVARAADKRCVSIANLLSNPRCTADLVYSRLSAGRHRRRTHAAVQALVRDAVERCWCGGELDAFAFHHSYGRCRACGGYVNRRPPAREALAELYSLDFYWHGRVRTKGQPPIERRAAVDHSDGRVQYWLGLIERHAPDARRVLEVGCGSGVLLAELKSRGYDCTGVEPDPATAAWTQANTGVTIEAGLFPFDGLPEVELFMAFDVIEHTRDPVAFLEGAASVLAPGGVAIVQTPIDRDRLDPPFGRSAGKAFDDVEHTYLFTDAAMEVLADRAGLLVCDLTERLWVQHEIVVFEKPRSATLAAAVAA
jgi:SAM-dependent methyltransferase